MRADQVIMDKILEVRRRLNSLKRRKLSRENPMR
jgi:hypothetical protein